MIEIRYQQKTIGSWREREKKRMNSPRILGSFVHLFIYFIKFVWISIGPPLDNVFLAACGDDVSFQCSGNSYLLNWQQRSFKAGDNRRLAGERIMLLLQKPIDVIIMMLYPPAPRPPPPEV